MVNDSLDDVIKKISAIASQTTDVTNTSDEYELWRSYVNLAQREWAETYDWKELYREYNSLTSRSTGNATITLPGDFRKLSGYPKITADGVSTYSYPAIPPQTRDMHAGDENFCYILEDLGHSYLVVNPGTLASGASIYVPYWKSPASLCSPADIIECPNPDYLVQRSIGYVWEAREDSRFPQAKVDAEKILARMIESQNAGGYADESKIRTQEEKSFSFRIGRD